MAIDLEIPYLHLFSGKDLEVGNVVIKHPTLNDILSIDSLNQEAIYWTYIAILLSDPYDNMVELWDNGIDYETITPFDLFIMNWKESQLVYEEHKLIWDKENVSPLDVYKQALSLFLGERSWDIRQRLGSDEYVIFDKDDVEYEIDVNIYTILVEFIKQIHCLDYSERIKPKNKMVKQMLIEDKKLELERSNLKKDKNKLNIISSMVSAICVGGNGSINLFNIKDLHIFQIYQYFTLMMKKNNVDKLLNGIYAGTIDAKTIKDDDLKWTI